MSIHRWQEEALTFDASGERLVGIVTHPAPGPRDGTPASSLGVLVVVGGPQYRVGSHRQFVLLARALASRGYTAMRFDCTGMGDSTGTEPAFTERDGDLRAAIDAFMTQVPTVTDIVIWGLCDAASAALLYAADDARVKHLVLLNPWVRSEAGLARTHLKHYYASRFLDRAFWRSLIGGKVGVGRALKGLVSTVLTARRSRDAGTEGLGFQARMARGWKRFGGNILLICSGDDLTAREFLDHAKSDGQWAGLIEQTRVSRCDLVEADHTFSRAEWRDQVARQTADWLDERVSRSRGERRRPLKDASPRTPRALA